MAAPPRPEDHFRRRLVSLFALTLMEREGPIHGYLVSERIAQRTEGAWRPGPGAVYPGLRILAKSGFVRSKVVGRRTVYAITPAGRALLARIRSGREQFLRAKPDLGLLWAEVMGSEDMGTLLLLRLRRSLEALEAQLARPPPGRDQKENLRDQVLAELSQSAVRIRGSTTKPLTAVTPAGR